MISNPLENHPILTNMVRDTRRMLDETAAEKGRGRLLLGARVGPSIADPPGTDYPGGSPRIDLSCQLLGLDVAKWVEEGLVDYLCPSLFGPMLPGIPKTAEFVRLVGQGDIGVYPSVFGLPAWGHDRISMSDMTVDETKEMMKRHRDHLCRAALQCYEEGADGISTYNWSGADPRKLAAVQHGQARTDQYRDSLPYMLTNFFVYPFLRSPEALRECLKAEPIVTGRDCRWPD
jgi:hypothetical protein